MTKLFKNSKQILAFVFAFAVLAVSLFTGSINIDAEACDVSKIDYWDGTKASSFASGTGEEGNPYIIKTAEQLAFACLGQTPDTSTGKYYKVDDSVKVFVMQPQNVVDLDTLLSLDSAEAVKTYLTGLTGVKNWHSQFNFSSFNGHFDGNGATIYGLYVDTVNVTRTDDCGLFPQFDGGHKDGSGNIVPTTCKNIAVKNSYYLAKRRLGGIVGAAYGTGYAAKIDGKVVVDNCAVINCYMEGNAQNINHYGEEGIVVGGGALDVIQVNNILVKGVYARDTVQNKRIPIIAATSNQKIPNPADPTKTIYQTKISNSIFLGVAPYQSDYYVDQLCQEYIFSNVITDAAAGKVTITNPAGWGTPTTTRNYTEEQIKQVTATGFDFQAAATNFDWENTWFMSENGPELRKFHGEITFTKTNETHVWECADCGLQSPGGVADHDFVLQGSEVKGDGSDVYACSVCGHTCQHGSQTDEAYDPGDCVTASGIYIRCNYCDWYIVSDIGEIPGHDLEYVPAYGGHCAEDGYAEHWYCKVCEKRFATEDKFAPMEDAVTIADLSTGLGTHIKDENEDGVIVLYDENGHWFICKIENGEVRIDSQNRELADGEVEKHNFKNAQCVDCGYICEDHDFKATGKVYPGTCDKGEETEYKCSKCGWKTTEITKEAGHTIVKVDEVPPTDKLEGTKAHYYCTVCKEIYGDAQGTISVTKASLIIPKQLPDGYDNNVNPNSGSNNGYNVNADGSVISPTTGENVAPVVVTVMAIIAVAFVLIRKVVKA